MGRNMRTLISSFGLILLLASSNSLGDPPQGDGDGGATCDPPCHTFECHGAWCILCNDDGCIIIRNFHDIE